MLAEALENATTHGGGGREFTRYVKMGTSTDLKRKVETRRPRWARFIFSLFSFIQSAAATKH